MDVDVAIVGGGMVGASLALVNFGMDEIINPRLRDASRG